MNELLKDIGLTFLKLIISMWYGLMVYSSVTFAPRLTKTPLGKGTTGLIIQLLLSLGCGFFIYWVSSPCFNMWMTSNGDEEESVMWMKEGVYPGLGSLVFYVVSVYLDYKLKEIDANERENEREHKEK